MEHLSPQDERVFERVVVGELDPRSAEVRRRAQASPALAAALEDWRRMAASLDACTAEDRALVERARAETSDEDRARIAAALRARLRRRPRLGDWLGLMVAASLVVLAAAWLRDEGPPAPASTGMLGAEAEVSPLGPVERFGAFRVATRHPAWRYLRISVYDVDGAPLLHSPALEDLRWEPEESELALLRQAREITWEFELLDAGRFACDFGGPFRAWLSD